MLDDGGFGAGGVDHAAGKPVAGFDADGHVPFAFGIERRHTGAAVDERAAGVLFDLLEGTLDAVENIIEDTGTKGSRKQTAGGIDGRVGHKACGFLIDLNGCIFTGNADYLAGEALLTDIDHFHHCQIGLALDGYYGAIDAVDLIGFFHKGHHLQFNSKKKK